MKTIKRIAILWICTVSIVVTGCGSHAGKGINQGNSVDNVIINQIDEAQKNGEETETAMPEKENGPEQNEEKKSNVDYDLTQMNSDMVYAMVYQMMAVPEQYVGKTFRMDGIFYSSYYDTTNQYYFYCVIQDALACCTQGIEFVWEDGSHIYPDEYPEEAEEIIVEGTFETYTEEGDENLYCHLVNATLEKTGDDQNGQ